MFDRLSDSINLEATTDRLLLTENKNVSSLIRRIIAGLVELGVTVHPSSRLYAYARMFESDDEGPSVRLDHVLLESLQFMGILAALRHLPDPKPWLSLAGEAVGGNVCASDDRHDCRARSTQWELFTMACLTMAGFSVRRGEPDLLARIGGQDVAFAAKRLRADAKLTRNLRGGCKQLAEHRTAGFVSLDVSFISRLAKPIYVPRLEQQQAISAIMLDGYVQKCGPQFLAVASRPFVRGIWAHASVIGRSIKPVTRFVSRRWLLVAAEDSPVNQELSAAIQRLGSVAHC